MNSNGGKQTKRNSLYVRDFSSKENLCERLRWDETIWINRALLVKFDLFPRGGETKYDEN